MATRHGQTGPQPPPAASPLYVISPPGFFPPSGPHVSISGLFRHFRVFPPRDGPMAYRPLRELLMPCCPCCCAQYDGECCGAPGSKICCKDPDVCCGAGESQVCCEHPRECCTIYEAGIGESESCCTETQYCCNDGQGVCCEVGEICCVGDEGAVCCESNVVCCAGVCCAEGECCVDDVCVPCECEDDEDCPEGECCNGGVCGECGCEEDEDCGYCTGFIGPFQQYTQCVPPVIQSSCQDCEALAELCDELGGSYSRSNDPVFDFCACLGIVIPTTSTSCTAFNAAYNGSFTFEEGHCCDNECQYEPCDESPP